MKNLLNNLDQMQNNLCTNSFLVGLTIGTIGCLILIIISHAVINKKGGDNEPE